MIEITEKADSKKEKIRFSTAHGKKKSSFSDTDAVRKGRFSKKIASTVMDKFKTSLTFSDQLAKSNEEINTTIRQSEQEEWRDHHDKCWNSILLLPNSRKRQFWDFVVLILLFYTIVILPLRVAFDDGARFDILDVIVDILFLVDIIISFFSAYHDTDGTLVTNPKRITKHYLTTWFFPDVIATFPFYLIGESAIGRLSTVLRIPRLLKVLRLVRLIKLIRTYRLKKLFEVLEYSPRVHQGFVRIGKLLFSVITIGHFSACLWYFIGDIDTVDGELNPDSWIYRSFVRCGFSTSSDFSGATSERKYLISLYWSITTLTTVGYGDLTPETNWELGFTIIMMLFGATMFSYITATVSSVLHDLDTKAKRFRNKMTSLLRFVRTSNISPELHTRLIDTMAKIWRNEGAMKDVGSLRDEMPRQLCFEVALEYHAELLDRSDFFAMFSVEKKEHIFIGELVAEMKPYSAYDGEFVGNIGDPVDRWTIIAEGSVVALSPLNSDLELMWWQDGDSFGEVGIFLTQHWGWNMQCCDNCVFYGVETRLFLSIVAHHRTVSQKFVRLAGERVFRIQKTKKNLQRLQARRRKEILEEHRHNKLSGVHYRLRGLVEAAHEQPKTSPDSLEEDVDRHTAKGRWKFLREKVLGPKKSLQINSLQNVTKMALQVRKFQHALDEIKKDMRVWRQGMTIQTTGKLSHKDRLSFGQSGNYLLPDSSIQRRTSMVSPIKTGSARSSFGTEIQMFY